MIYDCVVAIRHNYQVPIPEERKEAVFMRQIRYNEDTEVIGGEDEVITLDQSWDPLDCAAQDVELSAGAKWEADGSSTRLDDPTAVPVSGLTRERPITL
jgi:hypothetical protein